MKHYHYIFAGSGLAALMTAYKMAKSGAFEDRRILLIDPETKQQNDRTWCFWQQENTDWDPIVYRSWETAKFADSEANIFLNFGTYRYNMIRGIDFYKYVLAELGKHQNIEIVNQKVSDIADSGFNVLVKTDGDKYTCNKLFNSIYNPELPAKSKYPLVHQHFIGWHIKTATPSFDANVPVFMDFSVPQNNNTRFMYVLPFSATEAIVEYTLFSKDLLQENEYERAIKTYLQERKIWEYEILDKEKGNIPMTVYPFWKKNTKNILHIGSAGGWTKASTGYTFSNSDKQSTRLIEFLQGDANFTTFHENSRFRFYDKLLIDILYRKNHLGAKIFSSLLADGDAAPIFKFLDEETSPAEELKVILKCPMKPFLSALGRNII